MVNEDEALFLHGKHVVIMDVKNKSQKFRLNNPEDTDQTALFMYNKDNVNKVTVGVAFKGQKFSYPYVFHYIKHAR